MRVARLSGEASNSRGISRNIWKPPEGRFESSPPFQRRGRRQRPGVSPEGTPDGNRGLLQSFGVLQEVETYGIRAPLAFSCFRLE